MKILLDECVTKRLKSYLKDYQVFTVTEMGWNGLKKQYGSRSTTKRIVERTSRPEGRAESACHFSPQLPGRTSVSQDA